MFVKNEIALPRKINYESLRGIFSIRYFGKKRHKFTNNLGIYKFIYCVEMGMSLFPALTFRFPDFRIIINFVAEKEIAFFIGNIKPLFAEFLFKFHQKEYRSSFKVCIMSLALPALLKNSTPLRFIMKHRK